jgi:hypothetical protein
MPAKPLYQGVSLFDPSKERSQEQEQEHLWTEQGRLITYD